MRCACGWPRYIPGRRGGDDHIYQEVMSGMYNRHYQLKPGDHVVDAGAHAGFYTCYAAEQVSPTGRVYAFEPEHDNYQLLAEHAYEYANVCTYPFALWDKEEYLQLHLSGSSAEHSLTHAQKDAEFIEVWTMPLAAVPIHHLDFMKIDVEGSELKVLFGAEELILRDRPHMAIEIETQLVIPIREWLDAIDYDLIQVVPTRPQTVFSAVPR